MKRILLLALLLPSVLSASAEVILVGKLYSITPGDFVILAQGQLFSIVKDQLPRDEQTMLEKNPQKTLTLHVPMQAIEDVRSPPPKK